MKDTKEQEAFLSQQQSAMSKDEQDAVQDMLDFIKSGNAQPGSKPGMAHALKLSYNLVDKAAFHYDAASKTLTYRYKFTNDIPKPSVGLLTALQDESVAFSSFAVGRPCSPGASLQMQTELLVSSLDSISVGDVIEMATTITKLGRVVTNSVTEFRIPTRSAGTNDTSSSSKRLAISSQVKYMPTGSWFADQLFGSRVLWNVYKSMLLSSTTIPFDDEIPLRNVIQDTLEWKGTGRATFSFSKQHTNPFGNLHGGCHAMLMETVGLRYAKGELRNECVMLQAIQIDYLKAPKRPFVDIECETLALNDDKTVLHARVLLKRPQDGKIASDGKLRFVLYDPSKTKLASAL